MKLLVFICLLSFIIGCSTFTRQHIITTPMISMTNSRNLNYYKHVNVGDVTTEFCVDDAPIVKRGNNEGLVDQVVWKAQKLKKAHYISNAKIFKENDDCVSIEGEAIRLKKIGKKRRPSSIESDLEEPESLELKFD